MLPGWNEAQASQCLSQCTVFVIFFIHWKLVENKDCTWLIYILCDSEHNAGGILQALTKSELKSQWMRWWLKERMSEWIVKWIIERMNQWWSECIYQRKKVKSLSCVRLFVTLWTVAHQVPLSMGFSRQEYWSGLPFPSPGGLPDPGSEPRSPAAL